MGPLRAGPLATRGDGVLVRAVGRREAFQVPSVAIFFGRNLWFNNELCKSPPGWTFCFSSNRRASGRASGMP